MPHVGLGELATFRPSVEFVGLLTGVLVEQMSAVGPSRLGEQVGHLVLDESGAVLPSPIAHIARDPFDPKFDQAAVVSRIKSKRVGIKRALLDQALVSVIGNIYADEALWAAMVYGEIQHRR